MFQKKTYFNFLFIFQVSMTIKNVTKVDGGLYTAKISNNVSDASAEFTLAVRDKPDKPTGT